MNINVLAEEFCVCKLASTKGVDLDKNFTFISKTDEEVSLVCPIKDVTGEVMEREDGWRAFRVQGQLDFSLIGIIAKISQVLASEHIGIFVISTFNTDYVLVKGERLDDAIKALEGICFVNS